MEHVCWTNLSSHLSIASGGGVPEIGWGLGLPFVPLLLPLLVLLKGRPADETRLAAAEFPPRSDGARGTEVETILAFRGAGIGAPVGIGGNVEFIPSIPPPIDGCNWGRELLPVLLLCDLCNEFIEIPPLELKKAGPSGLLWKLPLDLLGGFGKEVVRGGSIFVGELRRKEFMEDTPGASRDLGSFGEFCEG